MKNIKLFVMAAAVLLIVSCSWKIPESVSVKTNAEYNFTIGTFSEKLSKYLSIDTLSEQASKPMPTTININNEDE